MKNPNKIINYWKREKLIIVFISIFGVLYNVGMVIRPIYQGKMIDALVAKVALIELINLCLLYIVLISLVQIFRYYKRYYVRQFANKTTATMRFMLNNNILHKSEKELKEENMGALMTKAISDVDICVEGMRKITTETFDTGVLLITYFVTLLGYDVKITCISCIFVPVAILIAEKLKRVIFKYTREYRNQMSKLSDITYDRIDNAILYRTYGRENDNQKLYNQELEDFERKAITSNIWENSMQPIYNVISMTGIIFVIYMCGKKVISGDFSIGTFSAYISLFSVMAVKASRIAKLFNTVQKSTISWNRIKPYLEEYKSANTHLGNLNKYTKLNLKNVSFSYDNKEDCIKNITFNASSGEIIGITGPIGCGKSTLGKIFLGEFHYRGSIEIDDRNLKNYSPYERSLIISYLGHEPNLISDTIYNNITLGKEGNINHVLKMVCFEEDLYNMENGVNTLVGNGGVRLSGGQQSRIALARSLYHRNKILILDDPFSAVDMKTEKNIINNLKENYKDNIIILISHRLAIFEDLNKIILINENKDNEYGAHSELLQKSKLYKHLYDLQQRKASD